MPRLWFKVNAWTAIGLAMFSCTTPACSSSSDGASADAGLDSGTVASDDAAADGSAAASTDGAVEAGFSDGPSASPCAADPTTLCSANTYGYACTGTGQPGNQFSFCGSGMTGAMGQTQFCCTFTAGAGSCQAAPSVTCASELSGYTCSGTDAPAQDGTSRVCKAATGGTGYCCKTYSSTSCKLDEKVTGCRSGQYGFSCTGAETPDVADSVLTCGMGTTRVDGAKLYCCSFP